MTETPNYVTVGQAAAYVGVRNGAVYDAITRGTLASITFAGRLMVPFADLAAWRDKRHARAFAILKAGAVTEETK